MTTSFTQASMGATGGQLVVAGSTPEEVRLAPTRSRVHYLKEKLTLAKRKTLWTAISSTTSPRGNSTRREAQSTVRYWVGPFAVQVRQ